MVAHNGFGLYARWRFKAHTFNLALMMIEAQMFNLLLHRHWRKTRVITSRDYLAQSQIRSRNSSFLIFLGRDLKIILFENQQVKIKVKNKFAGLKHLCYICSINKYKQ